MITARLLWAATIAAALALPLAAHAQLPADGAGVKGIYGGSYVCTDGEHGFYLSIDALTPKSGGSFEASGVIGLFPTLAGASGPVGGVAGSLKVSGTIAADGTIAMTSGDWLKQPAGYGSADLEGKLKLRPDGGYSLIGKPVVRGNPEACSNLIATQFLP